MIDQNHPLNRIDMSSNRIIKFKKGQVLLFICLLYGFPKINAMDNGYAKNNVPILERATILRTTDYFGNFLFNSDTVPKCSNQEK